MTTTGIIDLPQVTWRPLQRAQPEIWPAAFIAHTAVSPAKSLWAYFDSPAAQGLESHLYVLPDGSAEQYVPVTMRADANGTANRWFDSNAGRFVGAVSAETWDGGNPATPWTFPQMDTMADVILWLRSHFQMPLDVCATPQSPGLGWHSMWRAPNPWSPAGHTCPCPVRIGQFTNQLLPLIQRKAMQPIMALTPTVTEVETYVSKSFQAAGNADTRGQRYWVRKAGSAPDPWVVFTDMDNQLGLA